MSTTSAEMLAAVDRLRWRQYRDRLAARSIAAVVFAVALPWPNWSLAIACGAALMFTVVVATRRVSLAEAADQVDRDQDLPQSLGTLVRHPSMPMPTLPPVSQIAASRLLTPHLWTPLIVVAVLAVVGLVLTDLVRPAVEPAQHSTKAAEMQPDERRRHSLLPSPSGAEASPEDGRPTQPVVDRLASDTDSAARAGPQGAGDSPSPGIGGGNMMAEVAPALLPSVQPRSADTAASKRAPAMDSSNGGPTAGDDGVTPSNGIVRSDIGPRDDDSAATAQPVAPDDEGAMTLLPARYHDIARRYFRQAD